MVHDGTVLLAALDRRHAIGRGNALPWHLPDDLRRFKALTLDGTVVMGRRTADSLGRALPRRRNLVMTRSGRVPFAGMEAIGSADALRAIADAADGPLWVIGGGDIFALALPWATSLALTWVDTEVEGADAFFPPLDFAQWREVQREHHPADAQHAHAFDFVDYVRA
jgi:dihydrofolate reductase